VNFLSIFETSKSIKKNEISMIFMTDNQQFEHLFIRKRLRYRLQWSKFQQL